VSVTPSDACSGPPLDQRGAFDAQDRKPAVEIAISVSDLRVDVRLVLEQHLGIGRLDLGLARAGAQAQHGERLGRARGRRDQQSEPERGQAHRLSRRGRS
jgi:hypothetical protein